MAFTVITTDQTATNNTINMSGIGDTTIIAAGVNIIATSSAAVRMDEDNQTLIVQGAIYAAERAINAIGGDADILIGATGSAFGNRFGIVFNDGLIDGVLLTLTNHGDISGDAGIVGFGDMDIRNYGTISGDTGYQPFSTAFSGYGVLIDITNGDTLNLYNAGTIFGSRASVTTDDNSAANIENFGSLIGDVLLTDNVDDTLLNAGLINGDVIMSGGADSYINRGLSVGDIDLGAGNDLYYGRYGAVEGDILLGDGDDTASGGAEGERIEGGAGIDRIFGFGGDDNLFGDSGNDVLRGGDGDDGVNGGVDNDDLGGGNGDDTLLGADGNDLLRGDMGADVLNGGDGFDRASYADSSTGITIDLADTGLSTGFAQGDSYVSIEAYEATAFADVMFGDDVNNLLRGMDGDDQISGRGGNDNLQGFDGDDILSGGTGNDTLNGGDGDDIAAFTGDQADYTFTLLGNGNIRVEDTVGSDGIDILVAVEFVTFGGGAEIDVTGLI